MEGFAKLKTSNVNKSGLAFKNLSYAFFILLFYFFIFRDALEQVISIAGYLDECLAVLAILHFVCSSIKNGKLEFEKYSLCIILFVIIGLLANFLYAYQSIVQSALPDILLNIKFWLALYAGNFLFSNLNLKKCARGIYVHVKLVVWLFLLLIIFDNLFEIFELYSEYGFRSTHLFYSHPTYFTWACVYLASLLIVLRKYVSHSSDMYFILTLILMVTTFKIKAAVTAIALLIIYITVVRNRKKINLLIVCLFAVAALIVGWNKIYFYFFSPIRNDAARYYFITTSIKIANDHFPFGSGFGTFASYISGVNYSPLYAMYGISEVHGISPDDISFISDSYWPMILGQTGWMGLILIIAAFVFLYLKIKKIRKIDFNLYGAGLMIFTALLVSSIIESAIVNPASIYLALLLGYILNSSRLNKRGFI